MGRNELRPIRLNLSREVRQEAGRSVGARVVDVGVGAAFIALMVARRWGGIVFLQDGRALMAIHFNKAQYGHWWACS